MFLESKIPSPKEMKKANNKKKNVKKSKIPRRSETGASVPFNPSRNSTGGSVSTTPTRDGSATIESEENSSMFQNSNLSEINDTFESNQNEDILLHLDDSTIDVASKIEEINEKGKGSDGNIPAINNEATEIDDTHSSTNELSEKLKVVEEQLTHTNELLKERDATIQNLEGQLLAKDNELKSSLDAKVDELKSLQKELDKMQEVVANLLKTHEQDQEEIKTMKQVISNSEEEHKKDVENVRVQKNKELVELEKVIKKMKVKNSKVEKKLAASKATQAVEKYKSQNIISPIKSDNRVANNSGDSESFLEELQGLEDGEDDALSVHTNGTEQTHHTAGTKASTTVPVPEKKMVGKDQFQAPLPPATVKTTTTIVAHPIGVEPSINVSQLESIANSSMSLPFEGDQDRSFSPSLNINESGAFTFDKIYPGTEANTPMNTNESAAAFTFDNVYHGGETNTSEFYIESIPSAIQQVKDKSTPNKLDAKKEAELNGKVIELQSMIDQMTRELQTSNQKRDYLKRENAILHKDLEEMKVEKDIIAQDLEVQVELQIEILELKNALSRKEQLLADYQRHIDKLSNKIEEMEQLSTYQQSELEDKSQECQELQAQLEAKDEEILMSQDELYVLEVARDDAEEDVMESKYILDETQDELNGVIEQVYDFDSKYLELENRYLQEQEAKNHLKKKIKELESQIDSLKAGSKEQSLQFQSFTNKLLSTSSIMSHPNTSSAAPLLSTTNHSVADPSTLESKLDDVSMIPNIIPDDEDSIEEEIDTKASSIAESGGVGEMSFLAGESQEQQYSFLKQMDSTYNQLENQFREMKEEQLQCQSQRVHLNEEYQQLQDLLEQTKDEYEKKLTIMKEADERLKDVMQSLRTSDKIINEKSEEIYALRNALDTAEKEVESLKGKVDVSQQKLKQSDEKYLRQKQDWNNKYEELLTEKEKMGKEWQKQLQSIQQNSEAKDEEYFQETIKLQSEIVALMEDNQKLKNTLEAKTKEYTQSMSKKSQELYEKEVETENALQMLLEHEKQMVMVDKMVEQLNIKMVSFKEIIEQKEAENNVITEQLQTTKANLSKAQDHIDHLKSKLHDEKKTSQERIQQLVDANNELQSKHDDQLLRLREYKVKLSTKAKTLDELTEENTSTQQKLSALEIEHEQLSTKVQESLTQVVILETENVDLATKLQETMHVSSDLQHMVASTIDLDSIRLERDELRRDKKLLTDTIEALLLELQYHKGEQQRVNEEIQAAEARVRDEITSKQLSLSTIDALEEEIQQLQQELIQKTQELELFPVRCQPFERQILELTNENKVLKLEKTNLQNKVEEQKSTLMKAQEELQSWKRRGQEEQAWKHQAEEDIHTLTKQWKDIHEELTTKSLAEQQASFTIRSLEEKVKNLEEKLLHAHEEKESVQALLQTQTLEYRTDKDELATLRALNLSLQAQFLEEKKALHAQYEPVTKDLKACQDKLRLSDTKYFNAQNKLDETVKDMDMVMKSINTDNEKLRKQQDANNKTIKQLEKEVTDLKKQLVDAKAQEVAASKHPETIERLLKELKTAETSQQSKVDALQKELITAVVNKEREEAKWIAEKEKRTEKIKQLEFDIIATKKRLSQQEADATSLKDEKDAMEKEINIWRIRYENMKAKYEQSDSECKSIKLSFATESEKWEDVQEVVEQKELNYKKEMDRLQEELQSITSQYESAKVSEAGKKIALGRSKETVQMMTACVIVSLVAFPMLYPQLPQILAWIGRLSP